MGKERLALPTFLREKFSLGVLFVQTLPEQPGLRCRRGGGAYAPGPASFPAWAAPLPPRQAPNGYPVNPTGRGLQRRLLPSWPPASAATRIGGDCGGACGLGTWSRRWKRTREAGPPRAEVGRAGS